MDYLHTISSPLGELTLASDGIAITGLWLDGQKYFAATMDSEAERKNLPVFDLAKEWLDSYFSGKQLDFSVPLAPKGSPFRQAVWNILCAIPYGTVVTYGSIAKELGNAQGYPSSARAVGNAVGHNPISIFIPCHRVVGASGNLTGYAGGIDRKIQLLQLEKAPIETLHIPSIS